MILPEALKKYKYIRRKGKRSIYFVRDEDIIPGLPQSFCYAGYGSPYWISFDDLIADDWEEGRLPTFEEEVTFHMPRHATKVALESINDFITQRRIENV